MPTVDYIVEVLIFCVFEKKSESLFLDNFPIALIQLLMAKRKQQNFWEIYDENTGKVLGVFPKFTQCSYALGNMVREVEREKIKGIALKSRIVDEKQYENYLTKGMEIQMTKNTKTGAVKISDQVDSNFK